MSATIFSGPCRYTMVMGNSFICSNHLACYLFHMFQPSSLLSTQVRLHPDIHPCFTISINHHRYTINITLPFYTRMVNCQKLFLSPTIVAFCWFVLATMVSKQMQTIAILLQQYSLGRIMIRISVNHKRLFKVRQAQNRSVT